MKLSLYLSLGALLTTLAAPTVQASTVTRCPTGQYSAYYVLVAEPVGNASPIHTQSYSIEPNPFPPPVLPSEPRRFEELLTNFNEPPTFYTVCSNDIAAFESIHNIRTGNPVRRRRSQPIELFDVLDASGQWVGTVWRDQFEPFDQGGSIGGQSYWECGADRIPVIDNFVGFSSGLDPLGINGLDSADKEQFYFTYIRSRFAVVDGRRMQNVEGCIAFLSKEAFHDSANLSAVQVWYRAYDPSSGFGDTP